MPIPDDHPLADEGAKQRALMTVAFTLFLDLAGFGIILPILPIYALDMDATPAQVALLSTAFSAAQFVMAPVLGRISDRFGRRPVMLLSIAGSVLAALVLGFASALWIVFAARVVSGASKANISTAHAYVADLVPDDQRAKHMGRMGAAMGMGFIFGPVIGGLIAGFANHHVAFFASAGLSAINFAMAFLWLPETHGLDTKTKTAPSTTELGVKPGHPLAGGFREAIGSLRGSDMAWLVVIAFCFSLSFAGMESTMALFTEDLFSWGALEIGILMTFIGVNMVVFQGLVVGRAVARLGETTTLAIGLMMLAIGMATIGGIDHYSPWLGLDPVTPDGHASVSSWILLAIGGMAMSGGNGLTMATSSALVSRVSSDETQGLNMGLKESASSLARVTGPVLAGLLFQHLDPGAPMLLGGLVAVINFKLALLLGRRMRQRREPT